MHVAVVDRAALRRYLNHMLLLMLRAGQIFAMTEELEVTEAAKNSCHAYCHRAGNEQQAVHRSAAAYGGVGTVLMHGEFSSTKAPLGSSFA